MNTAGYNTSKVNVFAPIDIEDSIRKSEENTDSKSWYVRGYATTPDLDLQEDIILPEGIEISHLLERGYINYEHQQADEYKIGVPTQECYVDKDVGLYVEAKLYKNNPHAKSIWNLAKNISKSGIERRLGFSIEGFAKKRNSDDPRIIEKTYITNIALTTSPANPNATWETFMKSQVLKTFVTGHGIAPETQSGAAALRAESFARDLYNLSYTYKSLGDNEDFEKIWTEVGNYLDAMGRYTPESAVMFLQLFKGLSRPDAIAKIDNMMNSTKGEK